MNAVTPRCTHAEIVVVSYGGALNNSSNHRSKPPLPPPPQQRLSLSHRLSSFGKRLAGGCGENSRQQIDSR